MIKLVRLLKYNQLEECEDETDNETVDNLNITITWNENNDEMSFEIESNNEGIKEIDGSILGIDYREFQENSSLELYNYIIIEI